MMVFLRLSQFQMTLKCIAHCLEDAKKVHKLNLLALFTWDKAEVYSKFINLYRDNFDFIGIIWAHHLLNP